MQIIELELNHYNFHCPATGEWITNEMDVNENAPSLLGYWIDEFWQEPFIKNDFLNNAWLEYMTSFQELKNSPNFKSEFASLEGFFRDLHIKNAVVFKIADNQPLSRTPYYVINMDFH